MERIDRRFGARQAHRRCSGLPGRMGGVVVGLAWAVAAVSVGGCRAAPRSTVEPPATVEREELSSTLAEADGGGRPTLMIGRRPTGLDRLPALGGEEVESLWQRETRGSYHTVRSGETLGELARRYGCPEELLAKWNGLEADAVLRAGQMIFVPAGR